MEFVQTHEIAGRGGKGLSPDETKSIDPSKKKISKIKKTMKIAPFLKQFESYL